jgi:hypothetical protein
MAVNQQLQAIFDPSYPVPDTIRETITRNVMRPRAQAAFLATLRLMAGPGEQRRSPRDSGRAFGGGASAEPGGAAAGHQRLWPRQPTTSASTRAAW